MILFLVTIKQGLDGKTRFTVQTPSGKATPAEMDVAHEFQRMIRELESKGGALRTTVIKPWLDANNPNRQ